MARKFNIIIREGHCKQCGICVHFCPRKVLTQAVGHCPEAADPAACIGYRLCEMRCPDFAIEVEAVQE